MSAEEPENVGEGDLERRYRWLLAWYPWEHRRAYEDDMLGVLMTGARPGQRWPTPGDAGNLALAAVRTRIGMSLRTAADRSWADAAATLGLLAAILLLYLHVLPLLGQVVAALDWSSAGVSC